MANFLIASLGNPGEEYENTRHNVGVFMLEHLAKAFGVSEWKEDKKLKAKVLKVKVEKSMLTLVLPQIFMNQSGLVLKKWFQTDSGNFKPDQLILIHDDMDLPIGSFKISYNRGSGGHRGVESVSRSIKSTQFTRIRVGVSPVNAKGVVKKPRGEEAVVKFILGKLKPAEVLVLEKVSGDVGAAVTMMVADPKFGREKAMGEFN